MASLGIASGGREAAVHNCMAAGALPAHDCPDSPKRCHPPHARPSNLLLCPQIPEDPVGTVSCGGCGPSIPTTAATPRLPAGLSEAAAVGRLPAGQPWHSVGEWQRSHSFLCPPPVQFVMFHGCYHDASGSWPYDPVSGRAQRQLCPHSAVSSWWPAFGCPGAASPPHAQLAHALSHLPSADLPQVNCPECLGLPEEVAHTKQALKCVAGLLSSRLCCRGCALGQALACNAMRQTSR